MGLGHSAVVGRAGDRDLELAGHELEFGVVGGPLTQQFSHGARIDQFVRRGAGEMVGGHVADGVARRLDGVQANFTQCVQHIGDIGQLGPVVLDVLTGGEVAVALVPLFGQQSQLAHLVRRQGAVGDRDTQHVGVQLQVNTVHQTQGTEFILGQRSVNAALNLAAELGIALCQKGGVEFVILVHALIPRRWRLACRGSSSRVRCGGNPRGSGWARGRSRRQPRRPNRHLR